MLLLQMQENETNDLPIVDQITRYIKSNGTQKFKISNESKFRYENIEECIKALTMFDRSLNILKFQESFNSNPIEFVKTAGLIEFPSNIEVVKKCKVSYRSDHTDKCFECRFNKNGNVNTMMTVCMNRRTYEQLLNIIVESDLPKKVLFSNESNLRRGEVVELIEEASKVMAANAEETGVVVNLCVVNGITVIEIPDI